ncbi:MAG: hypothetical protein JXB14_08030 [Candidatus Altiarchaeota archaeon]|nr:hypothetical protein [Candidatus Altiarchaeota archaeon]
METRNLAILLCVLFLPGICAHEIAYTCANLECLESTGISFGIVFTENASEFSENSTWKTKYVTYSSIEARMDDTIIAAYDGFVNLTKSSLSGSVSIEGLIPEPDAADKVRSSLCYNRTVMGEKYSMFVGNTFGYSGTGGKKRDYVYFGWIVLPLSSEVICEEGPAISVLPLTLIECRDDADCDSNKVCDGYVCVMLECERCEHAQDHVCIKDECCSYNDCAEDEICSNYGCNKLSCAGDETPKNHKCERIYCGLFEEAQNGRCSFNSLWVYFFAIIAIAAVFFWVMFGYRRSPKRKWYNK